MRAVRREPLTFEHLIRLLRIARALETAGMYNAAKLFRAVVFSQEIRERNKEIIARGEPLDREMAEAIRTLEAAGTKPDLLEAMRRGKEAARQDRTIPRAEIPEVLVCRDCGEVLLGIPPSRCPTCGAQPQTFQEFLPVYFLEPLHPDKALEALATAPAELEGIVAGLREEELAWVPGPGRWAIRDVLTHLLAVQSVLAARVEKMLAEDSPSLSGVAGWAMAEGAELPAAGILARFRESREALVNRLRGLVFPDWWRTGQHEEFGQVTILQQASYFARHERYHMPRMRATRRAIEARRAGATP